MRFPGLGVHVPRLILTPVYRFAVRFHNQLPILDPSTTVASVQKSNSFLFWTIVVIASQRLPSILGDRWQQLLGPYKDLLGRTVLSSPIALLTVQGLLYLCTWPVPVEYQARDQSWNLSGIATNAALYMGLHKPRHPPALRSIGVFGKSPMRSITWLACFYISTWLDLPRSSCVLHSLPLFSRMRGTELTHIPFLLRIQA